MASSKPVVIAALIANGAIAILKFLGFILTGSPSMLSETYHSISDTGNQVFLLIGIRYSTKEATSEHPFGYGKAQFFYSFLVAVLLFGIAGWESAKHGYNALTASGHGGGEAANPVTFLGTTFDPIWVNVAVLIGAILFESYAFMKANAELRRQIREYDWSGIPEAFRKTSDVTTLTAFTEDAIALGGAGIALVGVLLAEWTGNEIYDAAAALVIGFLLMGFALALAWENKRLLLGESLSKDIQADLRRTIREHPSVEHVDSLQSVYFGPNSVLVTADVSFDSELDTDSLDEDITEIEAKLRDLDNRIQRVYLEPEI